MVKALENNAQENSKPKVTFYAQPTAGLVDGDDKYAKLGLELGGQVNFNDHTYINAEIGGGTYRSATLTAGHIFNISKIDGVAKNMVVDLSVNGQYMQNNSKSHYNATFTSDNTILSKESLSWHEGDSRISAKAMVGFKGRVASIGFGVEGGYRTNHGREGSYEFEYGGKKIPYTMSSGKHKGTFVTPRFEGALNIGKNEKWQLVGNADIIQQNVGIRYYF